MSVPRRTTILLRDDEKRGIEKILSASLARGTGPVSRAAPPTEQLAIALYAEWWKKRYPTALQYPWEQMQITCPCEREAWLAVADMAILNLCS